MRGSPSVSPARGRETRGHPVPDRSVSLQRRHPPPSCADRDPEPPPLPARDTALRSPRLEQPLLRASRAKPAPPPAPPRPLSSGSSATQGLRDAQCQAGGAARPPAGGGRGEAVPALRGSAAQCRRRWPCRAARRRGAEPSAAEPLKGTGGGGSGGGGSGGG